MLRRICELVGSTQDTRFDNVESVRKIALIPKNMTGGYGETFEVRINWAKEIEVYVAIGREGFDKGVDGFRATLRFMLREDF